MKKTLIKTAAAVAATSLLLASLGASAADTHKCKKGLTWDDGAKKCVVVKK